MNDLRIGSVCTGYGGLDEAVQTVFGGELAWVADNDPTAARILAHHQPDVRNLGDITALDWHAVEPVDVLIGGYPCQPFSTAGKQMGVEDARHLWPFIARALRVLRPRYAIFENVANHLRIGFDTVLCDLADLGFDVEWCVVQANEVGAPHQRRRLFFLATAADAPRSGLPREGLRGRAAQHGGPAAHTPHLRHQRHGSARGGRDGSAHHSVPAAHPEGIGRGEGWSEPAGRQGRPGVALGRGAALADPDRDGREGQQRGEPGLGAWGDADGRGPQRWGRFAPAVTRWEAVTGRRAPWATDARRRLSPAFVEWMMGLEGGHVTAVPGLSRTQQLKALGNGVVPLQAAAALRLLTARVAPEAWGSAA